MKSKKGIVLETKGGGPSVEQLFGLQVRLGVILTPHSGGWQMPRRASMSLFDEEGKWVAVLESVGEYFAIEELRSAIMKEFRTETWEGRYYEERIRNNVLELSRERFPDLQFVSCDDVNSPIYRVLCSWCTAEEALVLEKSYIVSP